MEESDLLTEWNDARTAALFLKPCTPKHLNEELGPMLKRESANRPGTRTARGGGWRYHRDDLERVRAIMEALGCAPLRAAQFLHAMRVIRDRELLEWLLARELETQIDKSTESQLDIADQLNRKRRRFQ